MAENEGQPDEPEELLDDLESIKELLDEPDDDTTTPTLSQTNEVSEPVEDIEVVKVPVLEDSVEVSTDAGMSDKAFQTLLGDTWQESVEDLFEEARDTIEKNANDWLPEDTDSLSEALKVRIDASVRYWLEQILKANIGLLRERIIEELSTVILEHLKAKLERNADNEKGEY